MGNTLCYVGGGDAKAMGVSETFIKLFKEYPQVNWYSLMTEEEVSLGQFVIEMDF